MEACEKALEFCPMLGYIDGSPTQLVARAQEDGYRSGWRDALERVLEMKISSAHCKTELDVLRDWIKKELEEK